jgi:hypothetical protein
MTSSPPAAIAVSEPRSVPRYTIGDEVDLLWYHGLGQTCFERSTFGGMLERAEKFSVQASWPQVPVLGLGGSIIGYESGITARPTAEQREVSGYMPDEFALERYARVSLAMMRVERKDGLAAAVIAILFGDAGQRWAGSDHGRNGALYHLTAKGTALIDAAIAAPGAIQLTADQRVESICIANKVQPKAERSAALAVCARQAEQLERRARDVWHMVRST